MTKKIDDLLRDIEVPESLHQKLRAIPQEDKNEVIQKSESKGSSWLPVLVIVAALLLLVSVAAVVKNANDVESPTAQIVDKANLKSVPNNLVLIRDDDDSKAAADNYLIVNDIDLEMKRIKMELESVDLILMQRKTKRMQQKLAELKAGQLPVFNPSEQQSIALSMACQSAIEKGASVETFREQLEQIKLELPDSRGSKIATQLLESQDSSN